MGPPIFVSALYMMIHRPSLPFSPSFLRFGLRPSTSNVKLLKVHSCSFFDGVAGSLVIQAWNRSRVESHAALKAEGCEGCERFSTSNVRGRQGDAPSVLTR